MAPLNTISRLEAMWDLTNKFIIFYMDNELIGNANKSIMEKQETMNIYFLQLFAYFFLEEIIIISWISYISQTLV